MSALEDRIARIEAYIGIGPHVQEPPSNVGAAHVGNAPADEEETSGKAKK